MRASLSRVFLAVHRQVTTGRAFAYNNQITGSRHESRNRGYVDDGANVTGLRSEESVFARPEKYLPG